SMLEGAIFALNGPLASIAGYPRLSTIGGPFKLPGTCLYLTKYRTYVDFQVREIRALFRLVPRVFPTASASMGHYWLGGTSLFTSFTVTSLVCPFRATMFRFQSE